MVSEHITVYGAAELQIGARADPRSHQVMDSGSVEHAHLKTLDESEVRLC